MEPLTEEPTMDSKKIIEQYDQQKKKLAKEKKTKNPDGRITGYELKGLVSVVAGIRDQINGQVVEEGLAKKRFDKHRKFATKLLKNFRKAQEELTVIKGVCPEYPKDLEKDLEDYGTRKLEIAKANAGIPKEREVESVTVGQIRSAGNYEIYLGEVQALDASFKDQLERAEKIDKKVEEIMDQPLAKPEFDMIEEAEIPPELNVAELDAIWPMIKKSDG